jgi:hypothetical protein
MLNRILNVRTLAGLAVAVAALAFDTAEAEAQVVTNDCFRCIACAYAPGQEGHRVVNSRVPRGSFGLTHPDAFECNPGTCAAPEDDEHEPCYRPTSTAFSIGALNDAVALGDLSQMVHLIQAGGGIVEMNVARSALQVIGCEGAVIAHIPVRQELFSRLALAS